MIHDCVEQFACQAANINFNVDGLLNGFWQLTIDGLSWGAIYALVAVGYTLVFGVLRLINFAHSEIFMLGMFGAYFCLDVILGFTPSGNAYNKGIALTILYLAIAMLFAMLVSGSAAVGLEFIAYRPLRRRNARAADVPDHRHRNVLRATGIRALHPAAHHQGLRRVQRAAADHPGAAQDSVHDLRRDGLQRHAGHRRLRRLVLALLTDIAINRTKFGRGIRAVAQDPTTATLMGVSRERIIMTTFLIGGLLAGAAALLYTLKVPQGIIYSGGFLLGIKAFSAAVLGGIGNLRGALLGGLLLGIMENYGQAVFGTQWRDVVAFVLLVLVLLIRPTGILGESLGKARA